jgi:hypothetical protein
MGNLLFWLGIGAAQKGAGSKPSSGGIGSAHTINAIVQAAAAQNTKNPRTAYG